MLWERMAVYFGFGEYEAAKVMGLAAFGDPQRFAEVMDRLFQVRVCGEAAAALGELPFAVNSDLARFRAGDVAGLESLFGRRREHDESPTNARFADVAAALQERTEDALLAIARRLKRLTGESSLAYSGGVGSTASPTAAWRATGPSMPSTFTPRRTTLERPSAPAWRPRGGSPGRIPRPQAWPALP